MIVVLGCGLLALMIYNLSKGNPMTADTYMVVERISDGDTFVVEPREHVIDEDDERRVRLLNIDTMELNSSDPVEQCFAREARDVLEYQIPVGTMVGLSFDFDRYDQYGRMLAFVFPPGADGRDLHQSINAMLAREGLADAVYYRPNGTYLSDIEDEVADARKAGRGMFNPDHHCYEEN